MLDQDVKRLTKHPVNLFENLEWGERITKPAHLFQLCFATRQLVMMLVRVTGARSLAFSWQMGRTWNNLFFKCSSIPHEVLNFWVWVPGEYGFPRFFLRKNDVFQGAYWKFSGISGSERTRNSRILWGTWFETHRISDRDGGFKNIVFFIFTGNDPIRRAYSSNGWWKTTN